MEVQLGFWRLSLTPRGGLSVHFESTAPLVVTLHAENGDDPVLLSFTGLRQEFRSFAVQSADHGPLHLKIEETDGIRLSSASPLAITSQL